MGKFIVCVAIVCSLASCDSNKGNKETREPSAPPAASAKPTPPRADQLAAEPATLEPTASPSATSEPTTAPTPEKPPEQFAKSSEFKLSGDVGVGCSAAQQSGWLQVHCYKRNGSGGRPLGVRFSDSQRDVPDLTQSDEPADAGAQEVRKAFITKSDSGAMKFFALLPKDDSFQAVFRWSNTEYRLQISRDAGGTPSGKFVWNSGVEINRTCAQLKKKQDQLLDAVATEHQLNRWSLKLPSRSGRCQPSGLGAWTVVANTLEPAECSAKTCLKAQFEVAYVLPDGKVIRTALGAPFIFELGQLQFTPLRHYDWDDDGTDELQLGHELEGAGAIPDYPSIWTHDTSKVSPYAKFDSRGFVSTEQLDNDARLDIASYGPFVATLPKACGSSSCPARLVGPRFFAHSLEGGDFSLTDQVALDALRRACPPPPSEVLAKTSVVNAQRTAMNVACARAYGVPPESLDQQLSAAATQICGAQPSCPLLETLRTWARAEPPSRVEPPAAKPSTP